MLTSSVCWLRGLESLLTTGLACQRVCNGIRQWGYASSVLAGTNSSINICVRPINSQRVLVQISRIAILLSHRPPSKAPASVLGRSPAVSRAPSQVSGNDHVKSRQSPKNKMPYVLEVRSHAFLPRSWAEIHPLIPCHLNDS